MSSKPHFHTEDGIERRISEGRGQGHGPNYQSWLRITDFSSSGFRMAIYSPKLGRVVHLFSFVELCVFLFAEWNPRFVDIKENYPLNRERTRAIAECLCVRHPAFNGVNIVMTTDLFITEQVSPGSFRYLAWSTKCADELRQWRPVEKLQIEESYYDDSDDSPTFSIMTKEKVPADLIQNLRYVRGTLRPGAMAAYSPGQIDEVDEFMRPLMAKTPLNELSEEFSAKRPWAQKHGVMDIARFLIAARRWPVDLTIPIRVGKPLTLLNSHEQS